MLPVMPPHLVIVGLGHAQHVPASRVAEVVAAKILASGQLDGGCGGQPLPLRSGAVDSQRLLQPAQAERGKRFGHTQRASEVERLFCIHHQRRIIAQTLP
jgi:hypothetical protein